MINKTIPIDQIVQEINEDIDLFICSSSFEERCLSVAVEVCASRPDQTLICHNNDQAIAIGDKLEQLTRMFGNNNTTVLKLDSENPIQNADTLAQYIRNYFRDRKSRTVLIDTTTFTRESLLILTYLIRSTIIKETRVLFVYTTAKEYSTNESSDNKWLTKGVRNVRSVLGFSGEFTPSGRLHLITMVGFETERTIKIIDSLEPDLLSLGIPDENEVIDKKHFPINLKAFRYIESAYSGRIVSLKFSCKDAFLTKKHLEDHLRNYQGYNVTISALNNKISTLGAALFCFDNPQVQMCYASANQYNVEGYSSQGSDCILFELF